MKKIIGDKKNIIIILLVVLIGIMSINTFSLATGSDDNQIYTRDELSEKIENVEATLNNHSSLISNLEVNTTTNKMFLSVYPVGSIYISTSAENPAVTFGGSWIKYSEGRTLIGAGTGIDIDNITRTFEGESSGGKYAHLLSSNDLPEAVVRAFFMNELFTTNAVVPDWYSEPNKWYLAAGSRAIPDNNYAQTTISLVQPYVAVFIWKRIA